MQDHEYTIDTLLMHAAGLTGPDRSTAIEDHLKTCAACTAVVEQARSVAAVMREQRSLIADPPGHVATASERLFARVRPDLVRPVDSSREPALEGLRRILANITFDSLGSSAYAGLRAATGASRHLAYQSELGDLDLQVSPPLRPSATDARWQVMGQLELRTPTPPRTPIIFLQADLSVIDDLQATATHERATADVDEGGYFTVELQSGTWAACMVIDDAVLVFPGFTL